MHEDLNLPHPDHWISQQTDGSIRLHDPFDPDYAPLNPNQPSDYFFDARLTDGMDYLRAVTGRDALMMELYFTDGEEHRSDLGVEGGYFNQLVAADGMYAVGHTMPGTNQAREVMHAGEYATFGTSDFRNGYHQRFHETVVGRRLLFYAGVESSNVYGGPTGSPERKLDAMRRLVQGYVERDHVGGHGLGITHRNFEQWYMVAKTGSELLSLHEKDPGHDLDLTILALATPFANFDLIRKFIQAGSRLSLSDTDMAGITATAARDPLSHDHGELMTVTEFNDTIALQNCAIPRNF